MPPYGAKSSYGIIGGQNTVASGALPPYFYSYYSGEKWLFISSGGPLTILIFLTVYSSMNFLTIPHINVMELGAFTT